MAASASSTGAFTLSGPYRKPHNDLVKQTYGGHTSLHDADQAERLLGTRDAPIHGPVHLSQFTPLLLRAFGPQWFARGIISVHFRKMVSHLKPVQAHIELPPEGAQEGHQVRLWLSFEDGSLALEGSACLGSAQVPTMAAQQISKIKPLKEPLLIMEGIEKTVGQKGSRVPVCITDWDMDLKKLGHGTFPYTLREKLQIITETHEWFAEGNHDSPWGRPIAPPCVMHALMFPQGVSGIRQKAEAVGLLGGCELRMLNGPLFIGEHYEVQSEVIAVGETPKTEFNWTRTTIYQGDKIIGYQDLQSMSLKNSILGPVERGYAKASL